MAILIDNDDDTKDSNDNNDIKENHQDFRKNFINLFYYLFL